MPKDTKKNVALWATALCILLQVAAVSALLETYTASLYAGDGTIGDSVPGPAVDSPITSFGIRTHPITGELYFIDGDCAISKVDTNGNIVLVSGDPTCVNIIIVRRKREPLADQLYDRIYSISFDNTGRLFVAEYGEPGPVWLLDFTAGTSTQVGTIDRVYLIAASPDGSKLYYSGTFTQDVVERDVAGVTDTTIYTGDFDTFVVSPDGLSLWGSKVTFTTVSQLDIAARTIAVKVGSVPVGPPGPIGFPNGVTPGTAGVIPSFSALAFDRHGNLVIASANHVFYYETDKDAFSLIAGSGGPFTAANYPPSGAALSVPLFLFDVTTSPNSDVIYVDFQDNSSGYAFYEKFALDLAAVSIAVAPASIAEDAPSVATFTVTRSIAHTFPLTVNLALTGDATIATDYTVAGATFASGVATVVIPEDVATVTFTVNPTADTSYLESSETVIVTVTASAGAYTVGSPAAATLTITNVAQANGDPHMIGFQGQVYDFIGEANKIYNVLSDPALQVNMQLYLQRSGEHTYIPGPVMQKLGFATMHHQIVIDCGGSLKDENGTVTIDGRQLAQDGSIVLPDDKVTIVRRSLNTNAKAVGLGGNDHVVGSAHFVMEGLFEFTVYFIENVGNPHRPDVVSDSKWHRRFLDFNSVLLDSERRPHGVLGQTAAPVSRERSLDEWTIEGADADYVLRDGLFGKKFTFNQFQ